jgi:hypothetical protein
MALKKVDFKQILLEKGERIALFAGLGVMALMVVGFGVGSVASDGPQTKVNNLESLRKQAQMAYDQSQPDEGLDKLPPELNVVALKPVNPELYPAKWAFFQPLSSEDRKWRQPAVLGPDEFQVDLVRGAVQIYIITEDANKNLRIGVLKTKTVSELTAEKKKELDKFNKDFPGMVKNLTKKRTRQQFALPTLPPGAQGIPGVPGAIPGAPGGFPAPGIGRPGDSGSRPEAPGLAGLQGVNRAATQEQELKMVPVEKLSEENGTPAHTTYPIRVIQISAAFPYRAQLEEFRKALRLNSVDDLFYERAATPEFTGYSIQRRVIDPSGKVVQDWLDFDYETPMKQLRMRINPGTDLDPEDPVLEQDGIIWRTENGIPRLTLPRPKLYGPPREYKWPEARLAGLERTKDEMDKAIKENAPQPPKVKSRFDIDPFDDGQSAREPGSEGGMTSEGGRPGGRFPIAPPPGGRAPVPGSNPRPMAPGQGFENAQKPAVFPEHILVRFLDITVQPGYSYEYRIKIRMANPNYQQTERAVSNRLTTEKEIEGGWIPVEWTQNGQKMSRFHVSDELVYYAMQDEGQGGDNGSKKAKTNKEQAVVQVHRWLENVRTKPEQQSNELPVGDWSIFKERVVHRGEYIGAWHEVEIPGWLTSEDRYGLAIHPDEQKAARTKSGRNTFRYSKHKGIPVDFATDPVYGPKALVVDFEGGEQTINLEGKPKKFNGPVEMLIYTADGKLVVRNGQRDTSDPERQKRFQEWDQWLTQVKNQADNPKGGPNDVFSRPKGRGPSDK